MSSPLTPTGEAAVADLARRYRISDGAVRSMLDAVVRGGGGMAQFSIPELGGSGQWMRGGMTMVGDMFNSGLQSTVSNLCMELSTLLTSDDVFLRPAAGPGGMTGMAPFGGAWWPDELGRPSSTGGQNDSSYAYFPSTRRLAIRNAGKISIYDTGDHSISGVQQQQGGYGTLQFTSQFGTFTVDTLHLVGAEVPPQTGGAPDAAGAPTPAAGPLAAFNPQPQFVGQSQSQSSFNSAPGSSIPPPDVPAPPAMSATEIGSAIETLASLRDKGILTDEEFTAKKTELLARL